MYLTITTKTVKGKKYRSAKIVESYWADNTCKHRVLKTLGPVNSDSDEIKFRKLFEEYKNGNDFVLINDISLKNSKNYGVYHTVNKLFEKYEIDSILKDNLNKGKHKFDVYSIIKALIINRIEKQNSKHKAFDWVQHDYPETIDANLDNFYSSLDVLFKNKENIELEIFQKLKTKINIDTSKVHYDLTSSYFEGKHCEIAMFGYSRDHRSDRKQIVIGLVMIDGIPVYHEIHEGNTVDKATLEGLILKLKDKFELKAPTIIADRGLITENNLVFLEDNKQKYILGFSKRNNKKTKELIVNEIDSGNETHNAKIIKTETVERDNKKYTRTYVLCFDKNTHNERLLKLESICENVTKKLKDLKTKIDNPNKKIKISKESQVLKVDKILGKNKRLFCIDFTDKTFTYKINEENKKYEKSAAGKFLLITNTDLGALDLMKSYKELIVVESAFDVIKNQLDLRPIYHYNTERIKAHVFICILALLIEKIIERFTNRSAESIIDELKRVRISEINMGSLKTKIITEYSKETEDIFKKLKIKSPSLNLIRN